jgi:hypothetical protein
MLGRWTAEKGKGFGKRAEDSSANRRVRLEPEALQTRRFQDWVCCNWILPRPCLLAVEVGALAGVQVWWLFQLHIRLHQLCKSSKRMHTDYRYTHARNTPPHTHNHNLCHMSFLLPNHISTRFSCKTSICCGWEVRWSTLQMHCVTDMDHFKVWLSLIVFHFCYCDTLCLMHYFFSSCGIL